MQNRMPKFIIVAPMISLCMGSITHAGDLNPPPGPVMPTMKPLVDVEPRIAINAANTPGDDDSLFRISQSGSYYLPGNITGESGKAGIEIAASNVTIDLMGHILSGIPGSLRGIGTDSARDNIVVRNGTVTGWGGDGIDLTEGGAGGRGSLIEAIVASSNAIVGLRCNIGGIIRNCSVYASGAHGIAATDDCLIESCAVRNSSLSGILVTSGCTVRACVVRDSSQDGILASLGCTVIDCTTSSNTRHGITAVTGCTVVRCTSYENSNNGIEVDGDCVIRANTCTANGFFGDGSGIHVTSSDNRIEDNNVTDNDRGLDVDAAGNLIIKNTAAGNTTNYTIVTGNVGFYVNASTTGAVSGPSGGSTIGTSNPWANLSY